MSVPAWRSNRVRIGTCRIAPCRSLCVPFRAVAPIRIDVWTPPEAIRHPTRIGLVVGLCPLLYPGCATRLQASIPPGAYKPEGVGMLRRLSQQRSRTLVVVGFVSGGYPSDAHTSASGALLATTARVAAVVATGRSSGPCSHVPSSHRSAGRQRERSWEQAEAHTPSSQPSRGRCSC